MALLDHNDLSIEAGDEETETAMVCLAMGDLTLTEFTQWLRHHAQLTRE